LLQNFLKLRLVFIRLLTLPKLKRKSLFAKELNERQSRYLRVQERIIGPTI